MYCTHTAPVNGFNLLVCRQHQKECLLLLNLVYAVHCTLRTRSSQPRWQLACSFSITQPFPSLDRLFIAAAMSSSIGDTSARARKTTKPRPSGAAPSTDVRPRPLPGNGSTREESIAVSSSEEEEDDAPARTYSASLSLSRRGYGADFRPSLAARSTTVLPRAAGRPSVGRAPAPAHRDTDSDRDSDVEMLPSPALSKIDRDSSVTRSSTGDTGSTRAGRD